MNENFSSLIDQDLPPYEQSELLSDVVRSEVAQQHWQRYHLIGDVIRGRVTFVGNDLTGRISQALDNEATILAPRPRPVPAATSTHSVAPQQRRREPGLTREWKSVSLLALAASVAMMAVFTFEPAYSPSGQTYTDAHSIAAGGDFNHAADMSQYMVLHGEASTGWNNLTGYSKVVGGGR